MKKCLRAVFCQFGTVLDVVLCKALKLRGQAWVVFSTVAEATEAKTMMEGFPLYEKPLVRAAASACGRGSLADSAHCTALAVCAHQVGRGGQGGRHVPAAACL